MTASESSCVPSTGAGLRNPVAIKSKALCWKECVVTSLSRSSKQLEMIQALLGESGIQLEGQKNQTILYVPPVHSSLVA